MEKQVNFYMLLIIALILLLAGCRKQVAETPRPLAEWLHEDTEAAMRYINHSCTTFYAQKQNDSVIQLYSRMFRHFPHKPTGNRDTVINQVALALAYFNTASFYSRQSEPFLSLFDSLNRSGHPFLMGSCRGYLLAYQAYVASRSDKDRALKLAHEFAALPPQSDLSQELMSCHLVAWVLWNGGVSADVYISMQLRAVEAYRKGGKGANITGVLSQLSHFYRLSGEYDKAIDYSLQALDWELHHSKRNNASTVMMYGDMSSLYAQLFLYDKAFEMLNLAIACSREFNNVYMCDLYRMKTYLFDRTGETDSVFHYIDLTIKEAYAMNDANYINSCEKERANYYFRYRKLLPDSLPVAAKILGSCYEDSTKVSLQQHTETTMWYGQVLAYTGQMVRGKQLMRQAIRKMQEMQWDEGLYDVYSELSTFYVEHRMEHELAALFPSYIAMRDSIEKKEKINAAIGANVRYETGRKEQENRALTAEVALKERSLVYTRVILLLSGILLLVAITLIVQYRRNRRREQENHRSEISRLLSAQQEMNRRNEDLSQKLEMAEHTEVIDNVRQQLNPSLLSGDDETRFRQSFAALYPRYLPKLRSLCPEITKSDELVCMLIYLKQNSDEISLALGISRASVNSARSRIRKKLGLQKEDSLEDKLSF